MPATAPAHGINTGETSEPTLAGTCPVPGTHNKNAAPLRAALMKIFGIDSGEKNSKMKDYQNQGRNPESVGRSRSSRLGGRSEVHPLEDG